MNGMTRTYYLKWAYKSNIIYDRKDFEIDKKKLHVNIGN